MSASGNSFGSGICISLALVTAAHCIRSAFRKAARRHKQTYSVAIGSYTTEKGHVEGKGKGVRLGELAFDRGEHPHLKLLGRVSVSNPTFLCAPTDRIIYHVCEGSDVASTAVGCLEVDQRATNLKSTGDKRLTKGIDACYIACSPCQNYVAVANYTSGDLAIFHRSDEGDGNGLGPLKTFFQLPQEGSMAIKERQEKSHAHCCVFHPSGDWLYVCDLGSDALYQFRFQKETGDVSQVARVAFPAGSGPRHCRFHPHDPCLMLVVNELSCTVQNLLVNPVNGQPSLVGVPLSTGGGQDLAGNTSAELVISPCGRNVYVSNRGLDDVAHFSLEASRRQLRYVASYSSGGATPRNIAMDPSGRCLLVCNQDSSNVVVMAVGPRGSLQQAQVLEDTSFAMDSIFLLGNTTRCQKDFDCPPRCINGTCCYSLTKAVECAACDEGSNLCDACPENYYFQENYGWCDRCPSGRVSPSGSSELADCVSEPSVNYLLAAAIGSAWVLLVFAFCLWRRSVSRGNDRRRVLDRARLLHSVAGGSEYGGLGAPTPMARGLTSDETKAQINQLRNELNSAQTISAIQREEEAIEPPLPAEGPRIICPVCLEPARAALNPCAAHPICDLCLKGSLQERLRDRHAYPLSCYEPSCRVRVPLETIRMEAYNKFSSLSARPESIACSLPACGHVMATPNLSHLPRVQCTKCTGWACVPCDMPWHFGKPCRVDVDDSFRVMLAADTEHEVFTQCPTCRGVIEKVAGCNHMHHMCPGPQQAPHRRPTRVDFCFYCSTELGGGSHKYERDARGNFSIMHFPQGVFQVCIRGARPVQVEPSAPAL